MIAFLFQIPLFLKMEIKFQTAPFTLETTRNHENHKKHKMNLLTSTHHRRPPLYRRSERYRALFATDLGTEWSNLDILPAFLLAKP